MEYQIISVVTRWAAGPSKPVYRVVDKYFDEDDLNRKHYQEMVEDENEWSEMYRGSDIEILTPKELPPKELAKLIKYAEYALKYSQGRLDYLK